MFSINSFFKQNLDLAKSNTNNYKIDLAIASDNNTGTALPT